MDHEFKRHIEALQAEQRTKQGEVCDFCGQPPGTWVYLAEGAIAVWEGDDTPMAFDPEWCACDTCHRFIQADDRDGLLDRHQTVFRRSVILKDLPPEALDWLEQARAQTALIHKVFFDHWIRTVPPRPNEPENLRPN